MERAIQTGERLREILKQGRLEPLTPVFQLAWLIAFNEGLFDSYGPDAIGERLAALQPAVEHCELTLDSPREAWVGYLADWFNQNRDTGT